MELQAKKVKWIRNKKKVKEIYVSSFPKKERMPFAFMIFLSFIPTTKFLCFYDNNTNEIIGLIYYGKLFNNIFIMFFAVDGTKRNNGYGAKILEYMHNKYKKSKIMVSIEPVLNNQDNENEDNKLKARRKAFYLRNGFKESTYMTKLSGITQEILIGSKWNKNFKPASFITFFIFYSFLAVIPKTWKKDLTKYQ